MRILHVLHHSFPYIDGYSIRSKCIVENQRKLGIDATVLTSPHHEMEVNRRWSSAEDLVETFGDTLYHRTLLPDDWVSRVALPTPYLRERLLMSLLRRRLDALLQRERFDLIHAHSPVLCGLPALKTAKARGVPLVYEVRAFWEDALLTQPQTPARRLKYSVSRRIETNLMKRADAVVAISTRMVADISARGLPHRNVFQVPNGVDLSAFTKQAPDEQLRARHGVTGHPVVGFIGSFYRFEGLDTLVRAMRRVVDRLPATRLLLIGGGEHEQEITEIIGSLGLQRSILQIGRVPHHQVNAYYAICDVLVYPRRSEPITELVTPLKPLEAMAMGRAVLGSDVGGIKELFGEGSIGRLFRAGDADDLAMQLVDLLEDIETRQKIAAAGFNYVHAQRNWRIIIQRYPDIYRAAIAHGGTGVACHRGDGVACDVV